MGAIEEEFEIFVRTFIGHPGNPSFIKLALRCKPSDTIDEVKEKLQDDWASYVLQDKRTPANYKNTLQENLPLRLPINKILLVVNKEKLEGGKTLSDYGIQNKSTLECPIPFYDY